MNPYLVEEDKRVELDCIRWDRYQDLISNNPSVRHAVDVESPPSEASNISSGSNQSADRKEMRNRNLQDVVTALTLKVSTLELEKRALELSLDIFK